MKCPSYDWDNCYSLRGIQHFMMCSLEENLSVSVVTSSWHPWLLVFPAPACRLMFYSLHNCLQQVTWADVWMFNMVFIDSSALNHEPYVYFNTLTSPREIWPLYGFCFPKPCKTNNKHLHEAKDWSLLHLHIVFGWRAGWCDKYQRTIMKGISTLYNMHHKV